MKIYRLIDILRVMTNLSEAEDIDVELDDGSDIKLTYKQEHNKDGFVRKVVIEKEEQSDVAED